MNDLKFAFRQLLKNPGFTAVAVLTLALGIGQTPRSAIFSVANAVAPRPRPFKATERQLFVSEKSRDMDNLSGVFRWICIVTSPIGQSE